MKGRSLAEWASAENKNKFVCNLDLQMSRKRKDTDLQLQVYERPRVEPVTYSIKLFMGVTFYIEIIS